MADRHTKARDRAFPRPRARAAAVLNNMPRLVGRVIRMPEIRMTASGILTAIRDKAVRTPAAAVRNSMLKRDVKVTKNANC
jgi:hypothetical protein